MNYYIIDKIIFHFKRFFKIGQIKVLIYVFLVFHEKNDIFLEDKIVKINYKL
jgi:hypothetical protein